MLVWNVWYIEDESRNGRESLYVDHGQSVWKVTFSRAHEEQPGQKCFQTQKAARKILYDEIKSETVELEVEWFYLDAAMMEAFRPP